MIREPTDKCIIWIIIIQAANKTDIMDIISPQGALDLLIPIQHLVLIDCQWLIQNMSNSIAQKPLTIQLIKCGNPYMLNIK